MKQDYSNAMRKKYMTEKENENRKNKIRYALQDRRLIKDVYPSVTQVKIEYSINYSSVFGDCNECNTLIYGPEHMNIFEIDCINRECTQGYFNLTPIVTNMVMANLKENKGSVKCEGNEAPDHLYQKCASMLDYKITIIYIH